MKKKIFYLFLILFPFTIYLISGLLFNSNHIWMFLFTNVAYIYIGLATSKFKKSLLLSLPFYLMLFSGLFLNDNLTSIIILYLIFIPISIYLGVIFKKKQLIFIYILIIFLISFFGINYWSNFYNNFSSRQNVNFPKVKLYEIKTDSLVLFEEDKVIVLDFWTTTCGICFKKFPDFEKIYLKYKDISKVKIYSVNIPVSIDTLLKTKQLVNKLNYKFPTLYAKSASVANDSLGFNEYPHLIIIKNNMIRYNGSLITQSGIYNIENEIERLLID